MNTIRIVLWILIIVLYYLIRHF